MNPLLLLRRNTLETLFGVKNLPNYRLMSKNFFKKINNLQALKNSNEISNLPVDRSSDRAILYMYSKELGNRTAYEIFDLPVQPQP